MEKTGTSRRVALCSGAALVLILAAALSLRLYGIRWDGGYLFHPDERQIYMIADRISFQDLPPLDVLLSPASPLNPKFFAYGSLPIYLLRLCADLAGRFDPNLATLESSYLVGRALAALFDTATVLAVFLLAKRLFDRIVGLVAAALLAVTVLHVQVSHFYTADTPLVFFAMLTLLASLALVRRPTLGRGAAVGAIWGLALATKISAAPLGASITLAWLIGILGQRSGVEMPTSWRGRLAGIVRSIGKICVRVLWSLSIALLVFVMLEPYALIDMVTFATDVVFESFMASGYYDIPYTRQFIGTASYLYPVWQAMLWSLGLPLGIAGFLGMAALFVRMGADVRRNAWRRAGELGIPVVWFVIYLAITGSAHAKFLRYMLPLTPLLSLAAAWALVGLIRIGKQRRWLRCVSWAAMTVVVCGSVLYALAYTHIYTEPHAWLQANAWICEHVPPASVITVEHWDDPLPLIQRVADDHCYYSHRINVFPAYDRDDTDKLEEVMDAVLYSDYIILSTNRLYNTIPRLPERYPLTSRYYELLMGEQLGFELVRVDPVYPELFGISLMNDTFSNPDLPKPALWEAWERENLHLNLGRADESYSVYDHPKPLVFAKTADLTRQEVLALLGQAAIGLPAPPDEE